MNVRQALVNTPGSEAIGLEVGPDGVFSVATNFGFRTFTVDNGKLIMSRDFDGSLAFAGPISASNVFGLIGGGPSPHYPPNKFVLWEDSSKTERFKVELAIKPVRACLTRLHYALIFEAGVIFYRLNLDSPRGNGRQANFGRYETAPNTQGLCCLGKRLAVFPGRTKGQVQILDLATRKNNIFPAHSSHLQAMALSEDEELLATSSAQGTLIRVWSTRDSARICEFRRGLDRAIIFSLAFSPSGRKLAVTSDKSTLHIFDVPHPGGPLPEIPPSESRPTRPSHSRNSSMGTKPVAIPSKASPSTKRVSIGGTGTSPRAATGLSVSPAGKARAGLASPATLEFDRFSVAPSDSVSQAGPGTSPGSQLAWNDMLRQQPQGRAASILSDNSDATARGDTGSSGAQKGKYGGLASLPFAPKILSDTYSSLSCPFEMGDEAGALKAFKRSNSGFATGMEGPSQPSGGSRPAKGKIGWINEDELIVVGGGLDARWEKFRIGYDVQRRKGIERVGWKRYMEDDGLG